MLDFLEGVGLLPGGNHLTYRINGVEMVVPSSDIGILNVKTMRSESNMQTSGRYGVYLVGCVCGTIDEDEHTAWKWGVHLL
jgi:hypothetical protein